MSQSILLNGTTYVIPDTGDGNWGDALTDLFVALPQSVLQKTGGNFTLTANANFGATYGLLLAYLSTRAASPATTGLIRLALADVIAWKNNANTGNLLLAVNASDQLTFNGVVLQVAGNYITALTGDVTAAGPGSAAAAIGANKVLDSMLRQSGALSIIGRSANSTGDVADITAGTDHFVLRRSGTDLGFGLMVDANIDAAAAIAYSKLATITAGSVLMGNGSNLPTVTALSGDVTVNSSGVTAIGSGVIVNADVNASAAIDYSKLAALTSGNILVGSAGNVATSTAVTGDISLTNAGVTAYSGTVPLNKGGTGQTTKAAAFDALSPMTTSGDIIYGGASGTGTRLAKGTDGHFLSLSSGIPTWAAQASSPTQSYQINNLGLAASVAANAMTIALKQADGTTDPASGTGAVKVSFRSSTITSGAYNERSVTSALSLVVSSGSTLGSLAATAQRYAVYLIDNAGTVKIGIAGYRKWDDNELVTTVAEGGAGAADDGGTLYSDAVYSSVPVRFIGYVEATEATAGTWATSPSAIYLTTNLPRLQYKSADSSTLTIDSSPVLTSVYLQMTGNSVVLTPGQWSISATVVFEGSTSGVDIYYSTFGLYTANGDNTSSVPASITPDAGYYRSIGYSAGGAGANTRYLTRTISPVRYTVASTTTVYSVPYVIATGLGNPTPSLGIYTYLYAERIR